MLEGMHHVAVIASEEARTLDFYVNKLGVHSGEPSLEAGAAGLSADAAAGGIWYWSCSSSPTLLPG